MPIHPSRLALVRALGAGGLILGALTGGCKRRAPAPEAVPSASVSAAVTEPAPAEERTRCRRLADFAMTLDAEAAAQSKPSDAEADEDDDALMPFGVDIGAAIPTPAGFAVSGIRGAGQAFVALLGVRASHRIDLGELHGDPETPALAAAGERVLVAMRSSDAAGFTIKLGQIAGPESSAVEWGYELSKLGKNVTGVEIAATGARGVLVYQGEEKSGAARLLLGTFSTENLKSSFEVKPLDAKDAEMPRLTLRPGGYWLSWVRTLPEEKKPPKTAVDAGAGPDPEERDLLEVGLRVVEVAKLDEQGKQLGGALRIGEPRRQMLLYDVAPLASGRLLVAARSDSTAPGAEGGAVLLSEVGADGSVHEERVDDDEMGAGVPALLVDSDAKQPGPWLAMTAPNDATRIGVARGKATSLQTDPLLGHAEVIAVGGGHVLLQRARGRGVALEALDCVWPSDAPAEKK